MTNSRSRRGPRAAFVAGLLLTCQLLGALAPQSAAAAGTVMFDTKGVSDKPQSKLWYNDGFWWGCLNDLTKLSIYKLADGAWAKQLELQGAVTPTSQGGTCDALWDGTSLFVAVYGATTSKIYKLSYDSATQTYANLSGFPVSITMKPGSETIVITKDASGRVWLTYEAEGKIYVQWTNSADHKSWYATPYNIASATVDVDDIATIVTLGADRIGVLWSDQRNQQVCFRTHRNADAGNAWQTIEIVRSGWGVIDDHLNAKVDSQGRVYMVAKDYYDAVWVARRDTDGSWTVTTGASGLDCGTRPIIQLAEADNKLYVFYTRWEACVSVGTHAIEERVSYLDNLLFSMPAVVISASGVSMNEVQGTKQTLPAGTQCIVCQGSNGKAYWAGWGPISGIGGADPGGYFPPPPLPPANLTSTVISEGASSRMALYRMEDSGTTISDASGNGRSLSFGTGMAAPHWTAGVTGGGLYFDGDDFAQTTNSAFALYATSFTLEAWIKADLTNSGGTGAIFARGDSTHVNYMLSLTGDELRFEWSVDDTLDTSVKTNGPFLDGAWHHVAAVWDAAKSQGRLYIDGTQEASKTMPAPGVNGSWSFSLGALVSGSLPDKELAGTIDLAAVAASAARSSNFTPPLLYPGSTQRYVRSGWTASNSAAGILGYEVQRAVNGGTPVALLEAPTASTWFADFSPPDGFLDYGVRAVDGLTQRGEYAPLRVAYESDPPAVPSAPLAPSWTPSTATIEGPAFWEFEDGGGSTAADGTGANHTLQLGHAGAGDDSEPGWSRGPSAGCLTFDGNDDYCQVADASDLRFTGSYTIEAWVQRGRLGVSQAVLHKETSSSKRNYGINILSSGFVEFSWSRTSGSTRKTTSTIALADLEWHHVACTHDASAGLDKIYIDGAPAGSSSVSGTPYTGTEPVLIGARTPSSLTSFFTGDIDLVRISTGLRYTGPFTPPDHYRGGAQRHVVQLAWSLPASGLVQAYDVYRQPLPSGTNAKIATVAVATPWLTDTGASMEASYRYTIRALNSDGDDGPASSALEVTVPGPTDAPPDGVPAPPGPRLAVQPNPFNPQAEVRFRLDTGGPARVDLFDARGRKRDTLVDAVLPAGVHRVPLLGRAGTAALPSGVYFVRLQAAGRDTLVKAVLVK